MTAVPRQKFYVSRSLLSSVRLGDHAAGTPEKELGKGVWALVGAPASRANRRESLAGVIELLAWSDGLRVAVAHCWVTIQVLMVR